MPEIPSRGEPCDNPCTRQNYVGARRDLCAGTDVGPAPVACSKPARSVRLCWPRSSLRVWALSGRRLIMFSPAGYAAAIAALMLSFAPSVASAETCDDLVLGAA